MRQVKALLHPEAGDPVSGYTPQVGDRVRQSQWRDGQYGRYVTVTAVGRDMFLADDYGKEFPLNLGHHWLKVPEPVVYPERWMNVYPDHVMFVAYMSRRSADLAASTSRIAVIHLAADGTLTLHPAERES
jgi:hypothetical protein